MLNKVGVTKMDQTLADYIKRISEQETKPALIQPAREHNDYEVWPEEQGDADHKRNPYSRV